MLAAAAGAAAAVGGGPRSAPARLAALLDRPRLWRVTAALAALLLAAILVVAAQGSLAIVARAHAGAAPGWTVWCTRGQVRLDRRRLAYCARVAGTVVASTRGPGAGEAHLAVVGDFHLTLVRLPDGAPVPGIGTRVTAVGPLVRARDGQREVQAFVWRRG